MGDVIKKQVLIRRKTMSLKFKRYYPIILLLVAFLAFLVFAMGDQYVISYTLSNDVIGLASLAQ